MRIVILFAKAGGGHESSAKALKTQMLKQNPDLKVELIDILANSPRWQQDLFCKSYVFFTDKIPLVWSSLQILWKIDLLAKLTALPLQFQIKNHLQEILNSRPDKIICTYFLVDNWLNQLQNSQQNSQEKPQEIEQIEQINKINSEEKSNKNSKEIVKNIQTKIPIWTVVTDIFSPHSVWFVGKNCNYLVFSNRAKLVAQNRGVCSDNIHKFGVFFGEKFEKIGTKLEIENWKNEFLITQNNSENSQDNLTNNLTDRLQIPTLLVVGGGESMPNGIPILENLLNLEIQFNLIFVCGRNENLREKCDKIFQKWQKENSENYSKSSDLVDSKIYKNSNLQNKFAKNIQIIGFATNLYELINIADLIICKAGPATILEVISQQKPFLISHLIWEQEIGNKDFAVSKGVATYQNNPKKLAQKVQELFTNPIELDKLTQNYQNLQIQNDLINITKFLII